MRFCMASPCWGAVYFPKKLHFIKTAFVFFISMGILIFLNKIALGLLLGRIVDATPPFGYLRFSDNGTTTNINLTRQQQDPFVLYLVAVLAILFWVAAYYRLKEKQA